MDELADGRSRWPRVFLTLLFNATLHTLIWPFHFPRLVWKLSVVMVTEFKTAFDKARRGQ
jgi:hypothetical protein